MKHILLIISFLAFISCNSNSENSDSIGRGEIQEEEHGNKLSGKKVVTELEQLGYFDLTDQSDLAKVKSGFKDSYNEMNFFQGPLRGESWSFLDNRYYSIDCEELFEIGGLTEYLTQVKPTFTKLGLDFEFADEESEQYENHWKHTIELNGTRYTAYEGQFSSQDWSIAYVNFLEMLNAELRKQNSNEQFYPISCGNDGMFVLLTPHQLDFINQHYPNDNEHPTTLSKWKSRNGL